MFWFLNLKAFKLLNPLFFGKNHFFFCVAHGNFVPFYFGGTSLLIVVIVVMDLMSQIQAHLLSHQYEGMMKKANLKGIGGGLR